MSDLVKIPEDVSPAVKKAMQRFNAALETRRLRERIAQQDAEIEMLTRERDSSRKASQQFMRQWHRELATVETLKGLLRGWQMVCRAVQIGAEIPRTIEDLSLRTDQQLQPKGEQG
jgi:hypothetical protein